MHQVAARSSWLLGAILVAGVGARAQDGRAIPRRPEVWAITVGVGQYAQGGLPASAEPARNATLVHQWIRRAGWNDRHALLMRDLGSVEPGRPDAPSPTILPTQANLDWAVREWLFSNALAGDVVVFYFAGQTRARITPRGEGLEPRVDYLLIPTDGHAEEGAIQGWSMDRLVDDCARRRIKLVCWLATAVPEPKGALNPDGAAGPRGSLAAHWLGQLARWPLVTAWLGSEQARLADGGAGFTKALLEALGPPARKRNLASALSFLVESQSLRQGGFRSLGGTPPGLTLWADRLEADLPTPKPELVLQVGHGDKATALAATADGREIVTASLDSTLRVWSLVDRCLLRVVAGQAVGVTALALSRDERWLVSGGGRGAVFVYDRQRDFARSLVMPRQPHFHRITRIAHLPDGSHFVSLDRDGRGFLWDLGQTPLSPIAWPPGHRIRDLARGGGAALAGEGRGVVLATCDDGVARMYDGAGGHETTVDFARRDPRLLAVSPDGRSLAAAFDDSQIVVRDLATGRQTTFAGSSEPTLPRRLVFAPGGWLALATDRSARLIDLEPGGPNGVHELLRRPCQSLAFSPSGDSFAACADATGATGLWRLEHGKTPTAIPLASELKGTMVGFTGDSRRLVVGDFEGGFALSPIDPVDEKDAWTIPANRGRITRLSPSASRQVVLTLSEERKARVWDLRDRSCRELPGAWNDGLMLDDQRMVLIPHSSLRDPSRPALVSRSPYRVAADFFQGSAKGFEIPSAMGFDRVALSPEGSRLAAASDPAKTPLVCVWNVKTGHLTHWIQGDQLADPVSSLSFAPDGRELLTAGDAPEARLWNLADQLGEIKTPRLVFAHADIGENATRAVIRPDHPDQIVTGHTDGQVHVWSSAGGKARLISKGLVLGTFAGRVNDIAFIAGGRYLAVAGDGPSIWIGALDPAPHPIEVLNRLRPHHLEQVNAVAAWFDRPVLVSAGDDATLRFWDLDQGALKGVFAAARAPAVPTATVRELDWVFHTPEGPFDSTPGALQFVRFRRQGAAERLLALEKTHLVHGLSGILQDEPPAALASALAEPEPVVITPPREPRTRSAATTLEIALASLDFKDVRLYQNDVLIDHGLDQSKHETLNHEVKVRLVPGINRFYVMAGREGSFDSGSKVVEIEYLGPPVPGRLHVVALGIGDYQRRGLQFARRDAEKLSEFLHTRGIDTEGKGGVRIVLPDSEVTSAAVERAFDRVALAVEDRPQDTVVVFLAGHTGVFNPQRFCLLLPTYPFTEEQPLVVAARGSVPIAENDKVDPRYVLPYSTIELALGRMKALKRLVIVDACQAEAILDDPRVRAIQKWMDLSTRRGRTSYLMAARRGEPALEVEPLAHGLFTYTLLRGAGAIPAQDEPRQVAALKLPANADFDNDGVVSTAELDAYVKQALPEIAAIFPLMASHRREAVPTVGPANKPPLDPAPLLQGVDSSFPLVPIADRKTP